MKANELRTGNLVMGEVITHEVDHKILWEISEYPGLYKPIPLTEEWLLKLGFIYDEHKKRLGISFNPQAQWFTLFLMKHDFGFWIIISTNNRTKEINIGTKKYIHEVQNLYFALTGEELCSSVPPQ